MYKFKPFSIGLLALIMSSTAAATEPGTPMNCTDLVLAPGLSCRQASNPGAGAGFSANITVLDNDGRILSRGSDSSEDNIRLVGTCGSYDIYETALVYLVSSKSKVRTPIISVKQRCLDPNTSTIETLSTGDVLFDSVKGALVYGLASQCASLAGVEPVGCINYGGGSWIARINGFTPLADALRK